MGRAALEQAFWAAEMNARRRDFDNEIDVGTLARELKKAVDQNVKIVHVTPRNPAGFVQVIAENLNYIIESEYLTTSELAFLMSVMGRTEMHSNAVVDAEGRYMTISALAESSKYSVRQARALVTSLLDKGIIYEFVDAQQLKRHGRVVEERPLYLNPEIIFCGDRNRINATLCRLVMNADPLERRKILLPWKLWLEPGAECGRLLRRKTWLKKRKEAKP